MSESSRTPKEYGSDEKWDGQPGEGQDVWEALMQLATSPDRFTMDTLLNTYTDDTVSSNYVAPAEQLKQSKEASRFILKTIDPELIPEILRHCPIATSTTPAADIYAHLTGKTGATSAEIKAVTEHDAICSLFDFQLEISETDTELQAVKKWEKVPADLKRAGCTAFLDSAPACCKACVERLYLAQVQRCIADDTYIATTKLKLDSTETVKHVKKLGNRQATAARTRERDQKRAAERANVARAMYSGSGGYQLPPPPGVQPLQYSEQEAVIAFAAQRDAKLPCHSWAKDGTCPYGDKCRYMHEDKPAKPTQKDGGNNSGQTCRNWTLGVPCAAKRKDSSATCPFTHEGKYGAKGGGERAALASTQRGTTTAASAAATAVPASTADADDTAGEDADNEGFDLRAALANATGGKTIKATAFTGNIEDKLAQTVLDDDDASIDDVTAALERRLEQLRTREAAKAAAAAAPAAPAAPSRRQPAPLQADNIADILDEANPLEDEYPPVGTPQRKKTVAFIGESPLPSHDVKRSKVSFRVNGIIRDFTHIIHLLWFVDSGCTRHMSPEKSDFIAIDRRSTTRINGINGAAPLESTGTGHIALTLSDTSDSDLHIKLLDAVFCPGISSRLFSVRSALRQGSAILFYPISEDHTLDPVCEIFCPGDGDITSRRRIPIYFYDGMFVLLPLYMGFDSLDCEVTAFAGGPVHCTPTKSAEPEPPPTPEIKERKTDPKSKSPQETPSESEQRNGVAFHDTSVPFRASLYSRLLMHLRLNHCSPRRLAATVAATVGSLTFSPKEKLDFCQACVEGKCHHHPVPKKRAKSKRKRPKGQLKFFSDWWGPYDKPGPKGERYIQCFTEQNSGYVVLYASSSQACGAANLARLSKHIDDITDGTCTVRIINSDSATVYTKGNFADWCDENGVTQRFSAPYTQQQNSMAERLWRSMETAVASMFCYAGNNHLRFWTFAIQHFALSHNCIAPEKGAKTPYENLTGRVPDISDSRVFGCPVLAFLEKKDHSKFTSKCISGFNLGRNMSTKDAYWIYYPAKNTIRVTRHVTFDELWRERAGYFQKVAQVFGKTLHPPIEAPPNPNKPPAPSLKSTRARKYNPDMNEFFDASESFEPAPPQPQAPPRPERTPDPEPEPRPLPTETPHQPEPPRTRRTATRPNGDNTNAENDRTIPITPANDRADIDSIVSKVSDRPSRYETQWSPSFNMTQAAVDARTSAQIDGASPFVIATSQPSQYNSQNFDVTWENSEEAPSTFLDERGNYLPMFRSFQGGRQTRSSNNSTIRSLFTLLLASAFVAPVNALYSSPTRFTYLTPSSTRLATALSASTSLPPNHATPTPQLSDEDLADIVRQSPTQTIYAFANLIIPSGATPQTDKEAMRSVDAKHWRYAKDDEYDALVEAKTWHLVKVTDSKNVISGKWVFKIKLNEDGSISRYKARWVARGFSQKEGIDFTEIFAPVVRYSSVRTICSLSNALGLRLFGLDISNAFARAEITEEITVQLPHGYEQSAPDGTPYACRLDKGLYGTKQAARLWNRKMRKFLLANGWRQLESDTCIFLRHTHKFGNEILGLYVDDIIHACETKAAHENLFKQCNTAFPTTTQGELSWVLGWHITRDFSTRTLCIDQTRHILAFLEKWGITDSKSVTTPMADQWKYGDGDPITDPKIITDFRSKVASMNYMAECTRPDISFAVHSLCRHLQKPNAACIAAANHLMCYLAGHPNLGIRYHHVKGTPLRLEAYADSSYGGEDCNQAKSTSGYAIYLGGGIIDWSSSLQSTIAQSSTEAEFISAFNTSRAVVQYRQLLEEFGHSQDRATVIWEDNQSCIAQSKNPVQTKRTKHYLLKYHYLRHLTESGIISLEYITTLDQVADIFTKPLAPRLFQHLVPHLVSPCTP
jgi:hypothetical protein